MKFKQHHSHHPSPFHDPRYAGHKTKPLLYTLKNNTHGLGISPHSSQVDQWWERAFDKQLNDMSVNSDGKGITVKAGKSEMVLRATGRWIAFVSAGMLKGGNMVGDDEEVKKDKEEGWETETDVTMSGMGTPVEKETKEAKKSRKKKEKEEKEKKKAEKAKRKEEKEARRLRRAEKKKRKEKREERRKKRK